MVTLRNGDYVGRVSHVSARTLLQINTKSQQVSAPCSLPFVSCNNKTTWGRGEFVPTKIGLIYKRIKDP